MRRLTRNIFMQCLLICALVTVGISPACAFIAGKMTMIEICGADGLVNVAVPADEAPGHDAGHERPGHDCGFCIAQSMSKAVTTPDAAIIDFSFVYADAFDYAVPTYRPAVLDGRLPARGPPVSL